jgi:hypothetical protein
LTKFSVIGSRVLDAKTILLGRWIRRVAGDFQYS